MALELKVGDDGKPRCGWCAGWDVYERYHDSEWGRPCHDDRRLFEKLCLESFQAGLSWRTILARREGFRAAFEGFDWVRMADYGPAEVEALVQDARIIRHRGKIEAVIHNAGRMRALTAEEGEGALARLVWSFRPEPASRPDPVTAEWLRANPVTPAAQALAKALRQRGWKFLGPTTVYAFMQSMGLVNDHLPGCWVQADCAQD